MPEAAVGTPIRALLAELTDALAQAPALDPEVRADAAREARLLLAGVLEVTPGEVARLVAGGAALPVAVVAAARAAHHRRARGEPLAYCVGHVGFRDLVLQVDARVLIPRPETEVVVDEALRLSAAAPGGLAVDVGTGSGAIALALASEGHFAGVVATDVSADALAVARANAARLGLTGRVRFRAGADLAPLADLKPAGTPARVIVSNPPYIAYGEAVDLPASVRSWEPPVALFADDDGMARYHALLEGAPAVLEPGGWLVLEVDARRATRTADRARAHGYDEVRLVRDLAGRDRVLVARCRC